MNLLVGAEAAQARSRLEQTYATILALAHVLVLKAILQQLHALLYDLMLLTK
jgi:hypothetical protein